jgi:ATP-dependent RNA circularization protein (DNA/RNA ligase family)
MEYHKINSIYKRNEKTKEFLSEYSLPEFEFLKDNIWEFTEKIDGTNVRVIWENGELRFGGKTDNAQMPMKLLEKLQSIFTKEKMQVAFSNPEGRIILYGEGFGASIQSGGKYIKDGVDFILFDVLIDKWWMNREAVEDIAKKLDLKVVKVVGEGTLKEAVEMAKNGFKSEFGDFIAEGIVLRPKVQLFSRKGDRIITKVKYKDFQFKQKGGLNSSQP